MMNFQLMELFIDAVKMQNSLERLSMVDICGALLLLRYFGKVGLEADPEEGLEQEAGRQGLPVPDHSSGHAGRKRKFFQKLLRGLLDGAARPGLAFHEVRGLERHLGDGSHATEGSSRLLDGFVVCGVLIKVKGDVL